MALNQHPGTLRSLYSLWGQKMEKQSSASLRFSKCFMKQKISNSGFQVQSTWGRPECVVPQTRSVVACAAFHLGQPDFFQLVLNDVTR